MKVTLQPRTLKWARERVALSEEVLAKKIGVKTKRVVAWEQHGEITVRQVEKLAHATYTPLGYLYLQEPPEEKLPIPDFRTVKGQEPIRPSPDLIETIQTMQQRQVWMRDWLIEDGEPQLSFVGGATLSDPPDVVATQMRTTLGMHGDWAKDEFSWSGALQHLRQKIEDAGVLIVINGVVGNNNFRPLDIHEFRGFALCDEYAPLIFINGADFKAAQMFTIAHELAHIWLGVDGISNFKALLPPPLDIEQYCNRVAAEFLVPSQALKVRWREAIKQVEPFQFLARQFKISSIVAARRALDLHLISQADFFTFYENYTTDERRKKEAKKTGGHFWNTQNVRIGYRFGMTVVRAVREGRLPYREAYWLTGLKGATFDAFAKRLGYFMS